MNENNEDKEDQEKEEKGIDDNDIETQLANSYLAAMKDIDTIDGMLAVTTVPYQFGSHDDKDKNIHNDMIIEKLNILKENLYIKHPYDFELIQGLISDLNQVIDFIEDDKKIKEQEEEQWEIIDDDNDNKYFEMLKKISNGYSKLARIYNTAASLCTCVYDNAKPVFSITQVLLSLYHGGPLGTAVLLWSWFSRK